MRLIVSMLLLAFSTVIYAQSAEVDNKFSAHSVGAAAASEAKAYGGDGGDAKAYGGYAKGGSAYGHQDQDQYQKAIAAQLQKASADNAGVKLSVSGTTQVDAQPAIAPAMAPGDPTAPCIATYGVSGAAGGVVALGGTGYEYDEICGGLEFFRATEGSTSAEVQAMRAVTIRATYAMLQRKIEDELGEDAYASAVGITVRDDSMKEARWKRQLQPGFVQASYGPEN